MVKYNDIAIGNFFKFLENKGERKLPFEIKFKYFSNEISEEDKNNSPYHIKRKYFPEKITDNDIYYLFYSMDDGYDEYRAEFFNEKKGLGEEDDYFTIVTKFGSNIRPKNIAVAFRNWDRDGVYMNQKGEFTVEGLDFNKLENGTRSKEIYYNTLIEINDFSRIFPFGIYAPNIAVGKRDSVFVSGIEYIFINLQGEPDITGVNIKDITNNKLEPYSDNVVRAAYINQLIGKEKFQTISPPSEKNGQAFATLKSGGSEIIKLGRILPKGHGYINERR